MMELQYYMQYRHPSEYLALIRRRARIRETVDDYILVCLSKSSRWSDDYYLLIVALTHGLREMALYMLDRGARVNALSTDGHVDTPLHLAVKKGLPNIMKILLEKGAEVDRQNKDGQTPLHVAARTCTGPVTKLLLDKGASINMVDKQGRTALCIAADCGNEDVVTILLKHGADLSAGGYTDVKFSQDPEHPLHAAVKAGKIDVVEIFLKNNCDINLPDQDGQTALHYAAIYGHPEIANLLLDWMPDVDVETNFGFTPMAIVEDKWCLLFPCLQEGHDAEKLGLEEKMKVLSALARPIQNYVLRMIAVGIRVSEEETQSFLYSQVATGRDQEVYKPSESHNELVGGFYANQRMVMQELREYYTSCEEEISHLENQFGCDPIQLKNILSKDSRSYLTDVSLVGKLESINSDEFPKYGKLIINKIAKDRALANEVLTVLNPTNLNASPTEESSSLP